MTQTFFVCGYCGEKREAKNVVIVSEDDYSGYGDPDELAKPPERRRIHQCGFLAIRCKEHTNAEKNAKRAMLRHLRTGGRVKLS